jgi:type VI secretion system secreted protein Hcp
MRLKAVRVLSVLTILAFSVVFLFARRAGSDPPPPPPSECALTIKIDDHPGESTVVPDAIDVDSFSWGVNRPASEHHGDDRVDFSDFSFVKRIDKSSPKLMLSSADRVTVPTATFEARRAGRSDPYLKYTLEDVMVTGYKPGGTCDGGNTPMEEVSLSFSKVTQEYTRQAGDGGTSESVRTCFDIRTHRPCR